MNLQREARVRHAYGQGDLPSMQFRVEHEAVHRSLLATELIRSNLQLIDSSQASISLYSSWPDEQATLSIQGFSCDEVYLIVFVF